MGWGSVPVPGDPGRIQSEPTSFLYFRVRVRKDLHRKWREMKDAGGFATDTDFVKHLLGVVDEEPTPVAQPPSCQAPCQHKARPFSQLPLPPQPHPLAQRTPCAREARKGAGKREGWSPGGQKAANNRRRKQSQQEAPLVVPGGWGLNPSTSSDVRPPTPAKPRARQTQEATEAHQTKSGRGRESSDGHHKAASDHAELDQDLADIRNGTLHHAAAEKPCVADVVSTDQAAKNSSSEENKMTDNEPQKVALEHGDPDREHVDSESAGAQNGVVTAVEESSAVEMAAKGATAMTPNVTPSDDTKDVAPSDDTKDVTPSGDTKDVGPSDDTKDVTPSDDTKDVAPSDDTKDVAPSDDTKDVAPSDDTKDVAPSDDTKDVAPSVDTNDVARSVDTKGVATSDDTMDTSKPPQ
eukprot:Em0004g583a